MPTYYGYFYHLCFFTFSKSSKDIPADETSKNAQLLMRAGYIHKEMAGVYSLLPLGLKVINNIKSVINSWINSAVMSLIHYMDTDTPLPTHLTF